MGFISKGAQPPTETPSLPSVLLVNPHRHPSVSRGENLGKNSAGERVVAGSGENDVVDG